MASAVEIQQGSVKLDKKEDSTQPAPVPVESAWKTPLTQKLNKEMTKEKDTKAFSDDVDKLESKNVESQTVHDDILETKEVLSDKKKDENEKEKGLPKIFDKKNFVEAPIPKTNPWGKKNSMPHGRFQNN